MAMEVLDKFCVEAVEQNFAFGLSKDANAILIVAVDGSRNEVDRRNAALVGSVTAKTAALTYSEHNQRGRG
jgi:hypothetical protein